MKIIDIHAHVHRDYTSKEYLVDEQILDVEKNGITLRVLSALRGKSVSEQNIFISEFCETHPQFIPCAVLNPKDEDCPQELDAIFAKNDFKAVELDSLEHGYVPEITPNIDEIFDRCGHAQVIVKIMVGRGDWALPFQWEYYIKRHPETKVVLLHMGGMWYGYSTLDVAAKYQNVYLDTSECFELPLFKTALKSIPRNRILFGSGFSERFTECSVTFFDCFPELSQEDRERLYYKNAAELLGVTI